MARKATMSPKDGRAGAKKQSRTEVGKQGAKFWKELEPVTLDQLTGTIN